MQEIVLFEAIGESSLFAPDENLWIEEYKAILKKGEELDTDQSVIELYGLYQKYIGVYSNTEQLYLPENLQVGEWDVMIYTKPYGKNEENTRITATKIIITGKISTPKIIFKGNYAEISVPEAEHGGIEYIIELKDKNGNPVEAVFESGRVFVPMGCSMRAKATGGKGWQDSEFTKWIRLDGDEVFFPWVDFETK